MIEQRHLAEQVTGLHQCDDRLAAVGRTIADGDAATDHDVEIVGLVALEEQDVASPELPQLGRCGDGDDLAVVEVGEQVG